MIHWNSPHKIHVRNVTNLEYYRQKHEFFVEYNGDHLRETMIDCPTAAMTRPADEHGAYTPLVGSVHVPWLVHGRVSAAQARADEQAMRARRDECYEYRHAVYTLYRTHVNYFPVDMSDAAASPTAITLVAQLSMDRLNMIESIVHKWKGPISMSVFASDADLPVLEQYHNNSQALRERTNIAIHIVFRRGGHYPVNYMRNVALSHARSPFVFLVDIDFVPNPGAYAYLTRIVLREMAQKSDGRVALVVPAFETLRYKFQFPHNRKALYVYHNNNIYLMLPFPCMGGRYNTIYQYPEVQ